jgi:hypothetical protein
MKAYTVLFAEDVPHYGEVEIKAQDDTAALEAAKAYELATVPMMPGDGYSACKRIVEIMDAGENVIAEDISLDDCFLRYGGDKERLLCDAAQDMLDALELCEDALSDLARIDDGTASISALNAARAAIAKAKGGQQ